jgi:predicted DNA repair protein MutK
MASSLLALLDDITTLLDDVSVLSGVALRKTSGVVGDDLALNAEQVTGFTPNRELPVVWAVAKGSLLNKAILVPTALLISAFMPAAIVPLLMVGGVFLCFEGFEKLAKKWLHHEPETEVAHIALSADPAADLVVLERTRIKGAIRTDFILSAEIVVLALGTMSTQPMSRQIVALTLIAVGITVLVYGLVAGIVKLDDLGLHLHRRVGVDAGARLARSMGSGILLAAPALLKTLSVVGTAAMFTVGGGIVVHGVPPVDHLVEGAVVAIAGHGGPLATAAKLILDALTGVVIGGVVVAVVTVVQRARRTPSTATH